VACGLEAFQFMIVAYANLHDGDSGSPAGWQETVAMRNTFIINLQGVIAKEYIKVDPTKHSEELLAALPTPQQMK
jgi:peroxiredoxin